ncbi:hypothetical protein HYPSUDRAFT_77865 [Hypholoma sublateritium FD-334 SS-4]|uniref:Uncharacterized protein n=1 Tax=Hypholoma sublateritium (strain FD-334 SS-4) TaxID=945553 RepID=A0A0D2MCS1_HYPSF|nr:hypothetical protein HYPSUDRAFT_77865 [Hypholoma sublateritium FD-334 SS-4]
MLRPPPLQLKLDNRLPHPVRSTPAPRTGASFVAQLYKANWKNFVVADVCVRQSHRLTPADHPQYTAISDAIVDDDEAADSLAQVSIALAVMYLAALLTELFGVVAVSVQRLALVRAYLYLAVLSTATVCAAAVLRGVAYFVYAEELVYECISLAGDGRVADRSTFVPPSLLPISADADLVPTHSARTPGPPAPRPCTSPPRANHGCTPPSPPSPPSSCSASSPRSPRSSSSPPTRARPQAQRTPRACCARRALRTPPIATVGGRTPLFLERSHPWGGGGGGSRPAEHARRPPRPRYEAPLPFSARAGQLGEHAARAPPAAARAQPRARGAAVGAWASTIARAAVVSAGVAGVCGVRGAGGGCGRGVVGYLGR